MPRAFISFLVFGNPDETLALVYEILRNKQITALKVLCTEFYSLVAFLFGKSRVCCTHALL